MKKKTAGVEEKLRHKEVEYISIEDLELDVEHHRPLSCRAVWSKSPLDRQPCGAGSG
jgi:hypothetical protein